MGVGDSYSIAGADAFEAAAIENGIDICAKANYEAGSSKMRTAISQIIEKRCCLATVVFAEAEDISALLLEAHRQHYAGEWIMGDAIMDNLSEILKYLNKQLDERSIHKLLNGMFGFGAAIALTKC